jgi:hypothetical protein
VISNPLLLLETRIVLFVDDDEAKVCYRCKEGAPGAYGDSNFARAKTAPHAVALARGKPGVKHSDVIAEPRSHAPYELRSQRDLGDEHDRANTSLASHGESPKVHLGLPASGHAMKKECRGLS